MTEEERRLWERYSPGDETAKKELVLFYLPLVDVLAKRIAWKAGVNWQDLRQDGVIGLIKAVERFNPGQSVPFMAFANYYIRGAIFDSPELTHDLARRQEEICRKIRKVTDELRQTLERNPTIEEVAEKAELSIEQINQAIDARGLAFAEALPDSEDWSEAIMVEAPEPETTILIKEALSSLSERDGLIIVYYYLEEHTDREIAKMLGLTTANVSKIRQRALIKLRDYINAKMKGGQDED